MRTEEDGSIFFLLLGGVVFLLRRIDSDLTKETLAGFSLGQ